MKITFVGVGNAFTLDNFQSNSIIESWNGRKMLIDAGGDIRFSLKAQGLSYLDIDSVYVSHLHNDHIGGFEYLAFCTYFDPRYLAKHGRKMRLIGDASILDGLWETIKQGVRSIQGRMMNLGDYFEIEPIPDNGGFTFEGTNFQLVQTVHIMDAFKIVPSYGLLFVAPNGKRIFHTTDTQFAPRQIETFYERADIIFQDCETAKFPSGVHAHYNDLKSLPDKIRAKMHLFHYNDGDRPDAVADGFGGFIPQGMIFDLSVKAH